MSCVVIPLYNLIYVCLDNKIFKKDPIFESVAKDLALENKTQNDKLNTSLKIKKPVSSNKIS